MKPNVLDPRLSRLRRPEGDGTRSITSRLGGGDVHATETAAARAAARGTVMGLHLTRMCGVV